MFPFIGKFITECSSEEEYWFWEPGVEISKFSIPIGNLAHLVEQRFEEPCVGGSSPPVPVENLLVLIILGIGRKRLQTQSSECEMERTNAK